MPLTASQLGRLRKTSGGVNRIKAARQLAGLTQVALAKEVGVTQSALSDFERQRWVNTSVDTARKFAEFFGCVIEDLFPAKQEVG